MNNIKIPIGNEANFLIGDIYISCQVSFLPMNYLSETKDKMLLQNFNSRLNQFGYELAAEISNRLKKELLETSSEANLGETK
jgi:hypothetical protein